MQNNSPEPVKLPARIVQEIRDSFKSFKPIIRNGWIVKLSLHKENHILLVFMSTKTCQIVLRYFTDEMSAINYIEWLVEKDPAEIYDL